MACDKRKNKVLLQPNMGIIIALLIVIVQVISVNSARAPLIQNINKLFDVSEPYTGNLGFNQPSGLVILDDNRWVIADTYNHRLVVTDDEIGTNAQVVGTQGVGPGQFNYPFDVVKGVWNSIPVIIVADTYNSRIQLIAEDSLQMVASINTQFPNETSSTPFAITIRGSIVYVADSFNKRVKQYDLATLSLVDDFQYAGFSELIDGIALDAAGSIYVVDDRKVVRFPVGGGPAEEIGEGTLDFPQGITFDSNDNMIVCDTLNNRVVVFSYASGYTSFTEFGQLGTSLQEFQDPKGVYFHDNKYYVLDSTNNRIQWFTDTFTFLGHLSKPVPDDGQLDQPAGVAFDQASRRIFVSNSQNTRIDVFDLDSTNRDFVEYFGSFGDDTSATTLNVFRNSPNGLRIEDNKLYVADTGNNRVISYPIGSSSPFITVASAVAYTDGGDDYLSLPRAATQCGGWVFVANSGTSQVAKFDIGGTFIGNVPATAGVGPDNTTGHFYYPTDVICGIGADEIVVVDQGNNRLQVLDFDLQYISTIGFNNGAFGQLVSPVSVSIKDERYWVLESFGRVTVFDTDGTPLTAFGSTTELNLPQAISVADAYVFIADTGNNYVRVYCGGLPVPTYEPTPELYLNLPVDMTIAMVTGGIPAGSYTQIISGSVPPGLTIERFTTTVTDDSVRIHGTPTVTGLWNVTAVFADSEGCGSPLLSFTLNITNALPFRLVSYEPVAQIPTSGNQQVTIHGVFDFVTTAAAYPDYTISIFIGGEECTSVAHTQTTITCTAPEGAGYRNSIVGVLASATFSMSVSSTAPVEFSFRPPSISVITPSPTTLPILGGLITITGDSLGKVQSLDSIVVKGLPCTGVVTLTEHTEITCILSHGAGNLNTLFLQVGSDSLGWLNTSTAVAFERPETSCTTPGTVIHALSTSGGADLAICGSNFGHYDLGQSYGVTAWEGRRDVYVKNRPCTITYINDTLIHCTIPPGAGASNKVWLNINSDINSWLLVDIIVRYPPPILTHIVPSRALVSGTQITVYGKNFGYWAPEAKKVVTIGDANDCSHVNVLSDGQLTCFVTVGSGDNQPVVVTVADQTSIPILTVDYKDHYTAGLPCEAPLGAQDPWFTDRDVCNCFSGFAPSDHTQTDCNVRAVCPGREITSSVASQFAPHRPTVAFSNDKLVLTQISPIVKDRRDVHIRFEVPQNSLGIPAGTPGAETCGYPGEIWTKTVDSLDCNDVFHLTMPWTQQAMCGFVQDSNPASNVVEFKAELVTEWRDILMERGQLHQKLRSVAYLVTVKFLRELKITSGSVSVMVADPAMSPIDVVLTSAVMYDPAIQNIVFTFITTVEWPYQIDTTTALAATYVPTFGGSVNVYAVASSPQPGNLICDETSSTICEQEWQAVITPDSGVCLIQGSLVFNTSQMLCRDIDTTVCPIGVDASTSFTLYSAAIKVCNDDVLDATEDTKATLSTFMDREFFTPSGLYTVGDTIFFRVEIVDPRQSIDTISVSDIEIREGSNTQTLYPASSTLIDGIKLNFTSLDTTGLTPIAPGAPAVVLVYFDLNRFHLTALSALQPADSASLIVEITLDIGYHGNNKKRTVALDSSSGSVAAATPVNVVWSGETDLADGEGAAFATEEGEFLGFWDSSASGLTQSTIAMMVVVCSALLMLM